MNFDDLMVGEILDPQCLREIRERGESEESKLLRHIVQNIYEKNISGNSRYKIEYYGEPKDVYYTIGHALEKKGYTVAYQEVSRAGGGPKTILRISW